MRAWPRGWTTFSPNRWTLPNCGKCCCNAARCRTLKTAPLERHLDGQLQLPGVQDGSRRPEIGIWRRRHEKLRRYGHARWRHERRTGRLATLDRGGCGVLIVRRNAPAKNRRAVDAEYLVYVGAVEQIERIEHHVE